MKTALIFATLVIFVYSDDSGYPSNLPKEFYEQMELKKNIMKLKKKKRNAYQRL